jgi:hypothetical protein
MPTVTYEYAGRRVHLVREVSDCDRCDNRALHVRLDPRGLSPLELARVLVHGRRQADLRNLLLRFGDVHEFHRTLDRSVVDRLGWLVQTGRLIAIECREPLMPYVEDLPPPPVEAGGAFTPSQTKEPEKTWVEILLLDDTGKPVPGQKYRIKTPDGVLHEGTLDDTGKARVGDLDPGSCDISFPEIDGGEWKPA